MRLSIAAAVLTVAVLAAPLRTAAGTPPSDDVVLSRLEPLLMRIANRMPGIVAVSIYDIRDDDAISINGNDELPAASVIKISIMVEVLRQIEVGRFTIHRPVMLLDGDRDCGFGSLCNARWGTQYTVRDLLWRMITRSDNTAANMLVRLVGRRNINQTMQDLGLSQTRLGDTIHSDGDIRKLRTSANDMMRLLSAIAAHRVVSDRASELMLEILAGQLHNQLLPEPLPRGLVVAHKTGTLHDTLNDVGIVELPGSPYVICVLTTHFGDLDDAQGFIRRVSRLTFDAFSRL